ncbi:MAG: nucleotidyl transferase AbiEii/AbiGii toxin family protein [Bacteroidetes bacterium]|nr:nucleotidyl transferase AbiEii/AbiGii toxin family protein [Bacteroidota bacterium]
MFHETISDEQLNVLNELSGIREVSGSFYLAGRTALALRLGHRKSYDFDFFTGNKFNSGFYSDMIIKDFGGSISSLSDDTVNGIIKNINISFLLYPYKLICDTEKYNNIDLASLEDLACMKCSAIMERGTKRDFFDIYEILKTIQPSEIKSYMLEKYKENGNSFYHLIRSLFYFEDAESDIDPVSLNGTTWEKVKAYLTTNEKKITKAFS